MTSAGQPPFSGCWRRRPVVPVIPVEQRLRRRDVRTRLYEIEGFDENAHPENAF